MKYASYILVIAIAIAICSCLLYCSIQYTYGYEGFFDATSDYTTLQTRLTTTLTPYCDLATYAQAQMKVIYTTIDPQISDVQFTNRIKTTYSDVYACRDDGASSRPSCSLGSGSKSSDPGFVSCDTYLTLPSWTPSDNGQAAAIALSAIPDDLADRISKEVDWYSQIITKLQHALDMGNNPPSTPPDSDTSPATNSSGKPWSSDGFSDYIVPLNTAWRVEGFDSTCTPAQAQQQLAASTSSSCTMPTPGGQIARVNAILDSPALQSALAKCASLKTAMVKLQSDQQKAKDGTLYAWQNDGPKKTYKQFPTGDRTTNFMSSMQQNQ